VSAGRRRADAPRGPGRSCKHCYAWGVLRGRLCRACENYAAKNPRGCCRACHCPDLPVQEGVCRLCRKQASLVAGPQNKTALDLSVAARTGQQLFFANMQRSLQLAHAARPRPRPVTPMRALAPVSATRPDPAWAQGLLCDPARDCRHVSSLTPPRDPRFLDLVLRHADALAERNGWPPRTRQQVRRGLRMLAAGHDPGEPIRASTVTALSPHGVPALRVLEVLTSAGDGLVTDDRPNSLEVWVAQKFADLPPTMREELHAWIDVLRRGTPRRRARPRATVFTLLAAARPFLLEAAERYSTLRQVTRDDVVQWLHGRKQPPHDASALRDLFRVLKAQRLVFTNPTLRIRIPGLNPSTPSPLDSDALHRLGQAAANDPALRVVLAFIGVHALQPRSVRHLQLDQIDLPNRRLALPGTIRRLDHFTTEAITAYLTYRHTRWPDTGNPHLLLTRRTAHERTPVSEYWLAGLFRGLPTTLRQLREDRILDEARAAHGDPLHLATIFGLSPRPALRYARVIHPGLAEHATN
jgi:hypothetical protein